MNFDNIPAGKDLPNDVYVAIEIPANHAPVKYEIDKDMGALLVDRFMATPMFYPANYGFIPHTLADDGDPLDALVVTPYPVTPGSVIRARPVGILNMTDEAGEDAKLVCVPHAKLSSLYDDIQEVTDLPELLRQQIAHFFENYKDLEKGKWVKVESWKAPKPPARPSKSPWPPTARLDPADRAITRAIMKGAAQWAAPCRQRLFYPSFDGASAPDPSTGAANPSASSRTRSRARST
ncbi:inorganic pyrophosphatase [Halomonas elongata]|uniref:Inorganic pyrophosphatase n=1 Tax=Halomonas elongata TaxID=2746 RepID=A0A1B8P3R0_HALEL|nr:inorganic pyrophosphatase [Halomonas elongata]